MDGKTPKIADFGLARSTRLKPVTQSMDVKGSAHYMSSDTPKQSTLAEDGASMHFVPAGTVTLPENSGS